ARGAKVVHLNSVRATRQQAATAAPAPRRWGWPEWGAIAATLVLGVLAGGFGLSSLQGETQLAVAQGGDGVPGARGKLAAALSEQLASAPKVQDGVAIGVSFLAKDGNYCRSFKMGGAAGLACREGDEWKIPVLAKSAPAASGAYRQAGSAMPAAVLDAIDQRAQGASLDAKGEQAAARRGWRE
ncbi:MAG: hypothetical protein ABIT83_22255, partial [Massilia sp.]